MIGLLVRYHENQLKKRRVKKYILTKREKKKLCSMVLLRKCYVARIEINNLQCRKSILNLSSYNDTVCSIRNTKTYIGFPRHTLSALFQV